jgi:hypothetical protein
VQELYVPFLMKKKVRAGVFVIFYAWLCTSLAVLPHIEVGLDQELSMPEDSYVLKYFQVRILYFFAQELVVKTKLIFQELKRSLHWSTCLLCCHIRAKLQ